MSISIEDCFEDVICKSQSGLGISDEELISQSGISSESLNAIQSGTFEEDAVRKVAPFLKIDAASVIDLANQNWYPEKIEVQGLAPFNTPFPVPGYEEMTVNAYLVWDPESKKAIAFDTGGDASGMIEIIKSEGLQLEYILLTHTHGDHIADLERLKNECGNPPVYVSKLEPVSGAKDIEEGDTFSAGALNVESRLTNGHSPGGITFVISGLSRPIAIVGDSIFAGSQGGAADKYQLALENNRSKILSLPDETVLCPGHGPLTSVAEEKAHNPFFPEFK